VPVFSTSYRVKGPFHGGTNGFLSVHCINGASKPECAFRGPDLA
jgi:hypothetical protein